MLSLSMPLHFKVGDTAPCRINFEPTTVHWRDDGYLVFGGTDAHKILATCEGPDLRSFVCSDAGRSNQWVEKWPDGGFTLRDPERGAPSQLIQCDGSIAAVIPRSAEQGWKLEELYALLHCRRIEVVELDHDEIMIIDEEGLWERPVNAQATQRARASGAIPDNAAIHGPVLITPTSWLP
jgi:hypothetical protein